MTLYKKTLLIISVTFACLAVILYAVSRIILLGSFAELEEKYTRESAERALSALRDEVSALDTSVSGWAARDDTYAFIEDTNEAYIQSRLADEALGGSRLNFVLFINSTGQVVFGKGFDLHRKREMPVPESLQEHLADGAPLLRHPDTDSGVAGIALLSESPVLIASRPILTGEGKGPARGALIAGRYLDAAEIERLAGITRLSLAVFRPDDPQLPSDFQTGQYRRPARGVSTSSEGPQVLVRPLGAESIAGYTLLKDVYGKPGLVLRVEVPREIYEQGLSSARYFISLLLAVSLVFGVMTLLLLDRLVLSRLARLSANVSRISTSRDGPAGGLYFSARVSLTGEDELSSLASAINGMLVALEQSQVELQEAERRFRDVTNTTGDWIWEVDAEGRYVYASPVVEQVLGYTPEEVLGRHYYDFFYPDEWEELKTLIQETFHRKESFVGFVSPNVHKDGREVILETSGLPLTDEHSDLLGYRGAHRDVTAERRLRERLAAVHALGRELVLTRDEQQVAQAAVDAARLLLGCQFCELWLMNEKEKALVRRAVWAAEPVADIAALPLDGKQGVTVAVARRGQGIYLPNVLENPRYVDAGVGSCSELCVPLKVEERVIGVLNAESKRVNAFSQEEHQLILTLADQTSTAIENARLYQAVAQQRERLRALTTRLAETEEAERRRLAHELHDRVGQDLTALGINLNIVRAQMPDVETACRAVSTVRDRLDDSLLLVKQTTKRIRDVMADLQPPVLRDYGLVAALRSYGAQFASRMGISVVLRVQGEESDVLMRLAAPVENGLFRIAQEALTNAAKHAQATQVTVTVEVDGEVLRMVVADDGVGFDPAQAVEPDGPQRWGLLTMAERAEAIDGHFRVESHPQRGTRVVVEVTR